MRTVSDKTTHDPLLKRANRLNPEVQPRDDLWAAIQARLGKPEAVRWSIPRLSVAALLLVSVSSALTLWLNDEINPSSNTIATAPESWFSGGIHPVAMGPEFMQTRTDLTVSLEEELNKLSPESREILATNLQSIDEAISEINRAMENSPNSELLLHLLLSTYTDQLTLLGNMNTMTRALNRRTEL